MVDKSSLWLHTGEIFQSKHPACVHAYQTFDRGSRAWTEGVKDLMKSVLTAEEANFSSRPSLRPVTEMEA